ncbi:MAG: hypothetical protein KAU60_14715 [Desulfobacterales bacterium]|nr:hypothetical protein [Desulfobacterales bacterium]
MKTICSCFLLLFFVFGAAICFAFNTQDIIAIKKAGFSDEIVLLMTKPTRSLQAKDIIELKKSGIAEDVIKQMILDDLKEPLNRTPTVHTTAIDNRLVADQIINLKKSGVSNETIQKMLDREERERARYSGVTRRIKHADGSESIVYGDLKSVPYPDTKHHYISTSEYLKSLSLSINSDDTLAAEEKKLWENIFQALRLNKDID